MKTTLLVSAIAMAISTAAYAQKTRVPGCVDLVWSEEVLAANPDAKVISNMTRSNFDLSFFSTLSKFSLIKSSEGFGGVGPAAM